MRRNRLALAGVAAAVGALLLAIGIVYLTVACENLPGILGPHPGDTSPRTLLGALVSLAGVAVLLGALSVARRRPPSAPAGP